MTGNFKLSHEGPRVGHEAARDLAGELLVVATELEADEAPDRPAMREIRRLLDRIEQFPLSEQLQADLRRVQLLTRQLPGSAVGKAVEKLQDRGPTGEPRRPRRSPQWAAASTPTRDHNEPTAEPVGETRQARPLPSQRGLPGAGEGREAAGPSFSVRDVGPNSRSAARPSARSR